MRNEWTDSKRYIARNLLAAFFALAGLNHFVMPEFYLPLIPDYLPFPDRINVMAGVAEVVLGVGLLIAPLRQWAAWGIVALLVAFIPSHVYFIQIGSCVAGGLCVPPWVAWVRLLVIHPLLIGWAWYVRKR
ncbi:DoxX family protein [Rhodoflexus caldus]|uniref:DoxX family protein n=1 Tax=Rhodoflexus caldus TaxID=2891236 RepID=UPI00202A0FB6|nr:DoxX family protein [Rhodoflexus caldus]